MRTILDSLLSPARNSPLSCFKPPRRPNCSKNLFSGSSRLIALKAVGAVLSTLTLCSSMILQNVLASGVPMGFPSKRMEVAPASTGVQFRSQYCRSYGLSRALEHVKTLLDMSQNSKILREIGNRGSETTYKVRIVYMNVRPPIYADFRVSITTSRQMIEL